MPRTKKTVSSRKRSEQERKTAASYQPIRRATGDVNNTELSELLAHLSFSLEEIFKKGVTGRPLRPVQWQGLVHLAVAAFSGARDRKSVVTSSPVLNLLEAFKAAYFLRNKIKRAYQISDLQYAKQFSRCFEIDWGTGRRKSPKRMEEVFPALVRLLSESDSPAYIGMCVAKSIQMLIQNEPIPAGQLDRTLRPWWTQIWKIAARGYYYKVRRPFWVFPDLNTAGSIDKVWAAEPCRLFATANAKSFHMSFSFSPDGCDIEAGIDIDDLPRAEEFRRAFAWSPSDFEKLWTGEFYSAHVHRSDPNILFFRCGDSGYCFTRQQWNRVHKLVEEVWADEDFRNLSMHLAQSYGSLT
jgi:hypothetical protein